MPQLTQVSSKNVHQFVDDCKRKTYVVLYHMNGCPHCEYMRPSWEQAIAATARAPGVHVAEVEYGMMGTLPPTMQQIRGFPTILVIRNGRPVAEYTGDRSASSLKQYILAHAQKEGPAPAPATKKASPKSKAAANAAPKKRAAPKKKSV